jgi:hypothetical protein
MAAQQPREYHYKLDFYWKALAFYALALMCYALVRGTVESGNLSVALYDPIVILLAVFVAGNSIVLLLNWYSRRTIIIGPDFIAFRNRFRERIFRVNIIARISMGKERRFGHNAFKVVKIAVQGKRRLLRLRPSLFEHEKDLLADLQFLRHQVESGRKH